MARIFVPPSKEDVEKMRIKKEEKEGEEEEGEGKVWVAFSHLYRIGFFRVIGSLRSWRPKISRTALGRIW